MNFEPLDRARKAELEYKIDVCDEGVKNRSKMNVEAKGWVARSGTKQEVEIEPNLEGLKCLWQKARF